jgi:TetR/AcrR family transcriptional regulator, transcriptional repressor for nem operon
MSKAQETRDRIIQQAAELFNLRGYAGSSMSDVMQATGLQKGGIYNHFKSKDDLALAAFDYAHQLVSQRYLSSLRGKRHAVDRLVAMLEIYEQFLEKPPLPGGCPILNTAIESDDTHPALRDRVRQALNDWQSLIDRILQKGLDRGEIISTTDAAQVATVIIALLEGAIMMAKLYNDPTYLDRAIDHLKRYVQTLKQV